MQIYAKTSLDKEHFAAKNNMVNNPEIEYSCDGLEIHLRSFEDIYYLKAEETTLSEVKMIHAPIRDDENNMIGLECIAEDYYAQAYESLFDTAQMLQNRHPSSKIGVVVHILDINMFTANTLSNLKAILQDKNICLCIENLVDSNPDSMTLDATIKRLRNATDYDNIYPCVDICHTIIVWESKYSQYPNDITYWDFLKHFFYLFSQYRYGLIHLASIRRDGTASGHGVPFDENNRFDKYLMENVISLYQIFCSTYNIPITLEVQEPNEDYISSTGYISTHGVLSTMKLRIEESLDTLMVQHLFDMPLDISIKPTHTDEYVEECPPPDDVDEEPTDFNVIMQDLQ